MKELIESLDSFWFFSNVFSSSTITMPKFQSLEENTAKMEEGPQKPILAIAETELVKKEEAEIVKKEEKISKRRKIRRRGRKILGEIDLGLNYYYEVDQQNLKCGASVKMPPFSDCMAMKEHLKSWAFAVASTVR